MENVITFLLRFAPELHAKLSEQAKKEGRSLHGQIIHILTKAVK